MGSMFGFGSHRYHPTHVEGTERGARNLARELALEMYPDLVPVVGPAEHRQMLRRTVEREGIKNITSLEAELTLVAADLLVFYSLEVGEQ